MKNFNHGIPALLQNYYSDCDQATKVTRKHLEGLLRKCAEDPAEKNFAWILGKSKLPWLPLDLDFPYKEMLQEAQNIRGRFVSHRSGGEEGDYKKGNKGWEAICLHGISASQTLSFNNYGYLYEKDPPYRWTELTSLCPVTTKYFKAIYPCKEYYRVRYTILTPGGYVYPHSDPPDALWNVNMVLSNPVGFHFKMKDKGYIPFSDGKAFILDTSNEHSVINFSSHERIHMIVHGNPLREKSFQRMIERSFQKVLENPESLWLP